MGTVLQISDKAHQALEQPGRLLDIGQAFIGIKTAPFPVLPAPQGEIGRQISLPALSRQIKASLAVSFHRPFKPFHGKTGAGVTMGIDPSLEQKGVLEQYPLVPLQLHSGPLTLLQKGTSPL